MPVVTVVQPSSYAISTITGKFKTSDIDQALLDFTRDGTAPTWVFDLTLVDLSGRADPAQIEMSIVAALQVAAKRGLQTVVAVTENPLVRLAAQVAAMKAHVTFRHAKTLAEAQGLVR